ncbi:MAG: CPBP family intramembrane metalloprotease [Pyrinomonadaceae bacterium]|nr:CPBP family intramembrane metalloprotease [Pyrinomonadaceae bacterium]
MKPFEIFINRAGRWRSGWRFLIFLLFFIICDVLVSVAAESAFLRAGIDFKQGSLLFISLNSATAFALAVLFGWLSGKYLEDLPFRALGVWFTRNWLKDLLFGAVLGALTLSLAVLIAVAFGGLRFDLNQNFGSSAILLTLGISLAVFIIGAAFEEAFFRGYILQTFARVNLAWLAIGLTSLFFAAGHLGNDNVTFFAALNTALAGLWFSIAYLKTRTLWLPFGLHLMWNWFQGAIFGIEVSGIKFLTTAPLLKEIDAGPIWLTGENYGIEGGIACTIALIVSTLLIWRLPIFKPTAEMWELTSKEIPKSENAAI